MAADQRRRAARPARPAARRRPRVEGEEVRPRRRGLERLDEHAAVEQVVAQVGPVVAAALPTPARRAGPEAGAAVRAQHGARTRGAAGDRRRRRPSQPRIARQPPPTPRSAQVARATARALAPATRRRAPATGASRPRRRAARRRARRRLLERPQRLGARGERRQHPALVAAGLGRRAHAQRRLGDHAERALRADQQLAQVGPGGAAGDRGQVEVARGRDAAQPARRARRCARSPSTPGRPSASPRSRRPSRTRSSAGSGRA